MTVHPQPTQAEIVHAHLRMRSGEVVPFATLHRALWGDTPPKWASEQLAQIVAKVRTMIPPEYVIEAQRKRGYILRIPERRDLKVMPDVTPAPTSKPPPAKKRSHGGNDKEMQAFWEERRAREAARKPRPCITCRKPFPSEGAHERMCKTCRANSHTVSPYAL